MWERISANPEAFIFGCGIWVPVAIWIVALVNWMIMGEIDAGPGLLGIVVALILGYLGLNPPDPNLPPMFFLAAMATVILAPMVRAATNRGALSALEVEAIGRAYELLATKPDNFGAKFRLARSLYNKGIRAHAVAIAEEALGNVPERLFPEEHRLLEQWKAVEKKHADSNIRIRCFECGVPNFPGTVFCSKCGAPYLLDYAQGKWVKSSTVKRLLMGWLFAMFCLIGIPTAAISLPIMLSVPIIIGLLILGVLTLVLGFKEPQTQQT